MNQNLIEAMTSIERARALLFAYEKVFLDLDVEPESRERADMAISTFYAIWEAVDRAANHLALLDGDCHLRRERCPAEGEHLDKRRLSERGRGNLAPFAAWRKILVDLGRLCGII